MPRATGSGAPSGPRRRRPTATSNFGVSRRESHDSSEFYARFQAPEVDLTEAPAGVDEVDRAIDDVFCGDSRHMAKVPDRSVALVVTSPPYFAGKEYEEALGEGHVPGSYLDYLEMLTDVFAECVRTLEPGGRIAVNVANLGRRPYRSLSADVTTILQDRLRLLLRGEVIWQKQRGAAGNCAWGSFQRPGNPVLRDVTERVVIASKGRFDRALTARQRERSGLPHEVSITRDEFMDATLDVWELPAESATRVGHPAPFPVALPERLIHLHTYTGDLVLDPFMGSGSTGVAAARTGRHWVGYDTDPDYVERARDRIAAELADLGDHASAPSLDLSRAPEGPVGHSGAMARGWSAKEVARAALLEAGWTDLREDVKSAGGVVVDLAARGARRREVRFLVCGGFAAGRGGLRRADVVWKALSAASVLHRAEPKVPVVLLATGLPVPGTPPAASLAALRGPGAPVLDVVDLSAPDAPQHLGALRSGRTR